MAASFEQLLADPSIVWMGQNTTHLEPPAAVVEAMERSLRAREFQMYAPPGGFAELRELILEDLGLPGFGAWITDGAVAGLHQVCTVLGGGVSRLITTDPGWPWPGRFLGRSGVPVHALEVYENPGRTLQASQVAEVLEPRSIIYLIDPLNPLGSGYARAELEAIVELARASDSYLVHDCTYRHFASDHTLVADLYPERTFTTYSFSKWLGLAGMRLGAVVARPELLESIMAIPANPLGSSIVGQRGAVAGLRDRVPWLEHVRSVNRENIARIEDIVAVSDFGTVVVPNSQGNFLAVDVSGTGMNSDEVCDRLLERDGVFIRPGTYQSPRFGERFVKISTSVPADWVDRFEGAWRRMAEERGR